MDLKQIEIKLARATTLPILPTIVTQVLAMTDCSEYSPRHYEMIIAKDAALAAKILRTANSPYFGGHGQITSLQRALSLLGLNTLRSICMTVAFQAALSNKSLNKRFDAVYFWEHSLTVACAAKVLACLKHHPQPEEAFIAGLLHDLGKLTLCMFLPQEADSVYSMMHIKKVAQYEAEQELLGLTHQEIGRTSAEQWGLPEIYHAPIGNHHTPTNNVFEIDSLTAFVHVGNVLAHEIHKGKSSPEGSPDAEMLVLDYLEIPAAQYEPLRQAVSREVSRIREVHCLAVAA